MNVGFNRDTSSSQFSEHVKNAKGSQSSNPLDEDYNKLKDVFDSQD